MAENWGYPLTGAVLKIISKMPKKRYGILQGNVVKGGL